MSSGSPRHLLEALSISGYATPATLAATEEKVRRLIRRLNLNARDAELCLGMLRQMLWKLRTGRNGPPPGSS